MTAIRFPFRSRFHAIWIIPAEAWLVLAGDHAWLCGSLSEAQAEAAWLSKNFKVPVRNDHKGEMS